MWSIISGKLLLTLLMQVYNNTNMIFFSIWFPCACILLCLTLLLVPENEKQSYCGIYTNLAQISFLANWIVVVVDTIV